MDPLTHAAAGALASGAAARRTELRAAIGAGLVAGMLADLDFFIHWPGDPLFNIEVHRQFTHSLTFIPVGGLVAALLLYWLLRHRLTFGRLFFYTTAAYATAGLLDACTSYGTVLLWPFSETRFAWNLISILDPLFTAGLLVFLWGSMSKNSVSLSRYAWIWVAAYLLVGLIQHERAGVLAGHLVSERGHSADQTVIKPTIGNLLLWRSTYIAGNRVHTDGIRVGLTGDRIYEGESARLVVPEKDFKRLEGSRLYRDLKRFSNLSDGYLVRHPDHPEVIGDARYAMLPTSLSPLWGVHADTGRVDRHLPFRTFRNPGPEVRESFLKMLLGR